MRRAAACIGQVVFLFLALSAASASASSWSIVPTVDPLGATSSQLNSVSCAKSNVCVGVGQYKSSTGTTLTLAERWDGSTWSIIPTPNPAEAILASTLISVSCATPTTGCTAVGYYLGRVGPAGSAYKYRTLIEQLRHGSWTIKPSPNPSGTTNGVLFGVSCTSPNLCTAVGGGYFAPPRLVERKKRGRWSCSPSQAPRGTTSPACRAYPTPSVWPAATQRCAGTVGVGRPTTSSPAPTGPCPA